MRLEPQCPFIQICPQKAVSFFATTEVEQSLEKVLLRNGDGLFGALPMKETDKQYYTRRGSEERNRARTAATDETQSIHDHLADLCHERANGSANMNGKQGIRPPRQRHAEG